MTTEKHFSSILGLIFLAICIAAGIYLTKTRLTLNSKASGDCQPINPQVANITSSSADISYISSAACLATVSVNNQVVNDVKALLTPKFTIFRLKILPPAILTVIQSSATGRLLVRTPTALSPVPHLNLRFRLQI